MITVQEAENIAHKAHHDQVDKQGAPYIGHVLRVAGLVRAMGGDDDAQIVALLHDVPEDTELRLIDLEDLGVPRDLLEDLEALTKREGESKVDAARRAAKRPRAKLVKLADNMDNTNPLRVLSLYRQDEATAERLARAYHYVREALMEA